MAAGPPANFLAVVVEQPCFKPPKVRCELHEHRNYTDGFSAEAIDQWFENLQNYEVTLEEMAAASLDVNFKEELSAIEQC